MSGHADVPLMDGLRNLEKGYDRKFALSFEADRVWLALEERDALLAENQRYEKALEQWLEAEDADDAAIAELHHPDQYGILRRNQERTRAEADAARNRAREALAGDTG